jgi:positive regulator of sigma E activity
MFKELVEVVEVEGRKITARCPKKSMCSCCSLRSLCGPHQERIVLDSNLLTNIDVGDIIEVGMEEGKIFLGNLILFFIPSLIFVLVMVVLKDLLVMQSFIVGIGILFLYYSIVRVFLHKKKFWGDPTILRKT